MSVSGDFNFPLELILKIRHDDEFLVTYVQTMTEDLLENYTDELSTSDALLESFALVTYIIHNTYDITKEEMLETVRQTRARYFKTINSI